MSYSGFYSREAKVYCSLSVPSHFIFPPHFRSPHILCPFPPFPFYQRVSIASYASAGIARAEMSLCPSVTLRYCIKTKKASVTISSPSESLNILVSRNIWFITKFDRGHPERERFLRLGWVRTGDFFSIFRPISRRISETAQDRTKVAIDH